MQDPAENRVSRRRYEREKQAREEAERLLEDRSRDLYFANQQLSQHSENLERAVQERTLELQNALEMAELASTMRSRFIATMSHEIRTPLGGLLGMIDLLQDAEADPEKRALLEYAQTSGKALRRIVNDVLDFSKIEAGAIQFQTEKVDLAALIDSVIAMARMSISDGDSRLGSRIDPSLPARFMGDATRIRQVVSNLVSNAVRYSKDGPIEVRAAARGEGPSVTVRVEVEDKGIGISPEQQDRLFKDFTQVNNELTSAAQGTGLGLAICKRIVEGCGGQIGVHSVPGEGSVFWFELPVEVAEPEAENKQVNQAPRRTRRADISGLRVLLAEDNAINQKLLTTYLNRMELDVHLVGNGREAIEAFAPGKYDIILMDVAMPEIDGLEATRKIRMTWPRQEVPPIVMLTAHVMDAIRDESELAGADAILCKPVTFDELQDMIARMAGQEELAEVAQPVQDAPLPESLKSVLGLMAQDVASGLMSTFRPPELERLVRDYVGEGQRLVDGILTAHVRGDARATSDQAHALKGASGLMGFREVSELAGFLEDNAGDLADDELAEVETLIRDHLAEVGQILGAPLATAS